MLVGLTSWTGFSSKLTLSHELFTTISQLLKNKPGWKKDLNGAYYSILAFFLIMTIPALIITYTFLLGFVFAISFATTARIRAH